jgi:hypothetical protein
MLSDWNLLSDNLQLTLSREALLQAAHTIAQQAEVLPARWRTAASPTAAVRKRSGCSPPSCGSLARTRWLPRDTRS